jgi:aspartate/methionine/tyrosine aminotransferase
MVICAPVISQIAAEAAVRDNWNYAHSFHRDLQMKRAALEAGLAQIPGLARSAAGGGFFKFVRVDGCRDSMALAAEILEQVHVVTIPGATFGAAGEGFLRLSYGAATVEQLTEACGRLKSFLSR